MAYLLPRLFTSSLTPDEGVDLGYTRDSYHSYLIRRDVTEHVDSFGVDKIAHC